MLGADLCGALEPYGAPPHTQPQNPRSRCRHPQAPTTSSQQLQVKHVSSLMSLEVLETCMDRENVVVECVGNAFL